MRCECPPQIRWLFRANQLHGPRFDGFRINIWPRLCRLTNFSYHRFGTALTYIQPEERNRIDGLDSALMQRHSLSGVCWPCMYDSRSVPIYFRCFVPNQYMHKPHVCVRKGRLLIRHLVSQVYKVPYETVRIRRTA